MCDIVGDVIKYGAAVFAEIGEVILGTKPVLNDKITIYKSLGKIHFLMVLNLQIIQQQKM